jgi:flagellum-specific peptidoglycan hydrolase FlgJ
MPWVDRTLLREFEADESNATAAPLIAGVRQAREAALQPEPAPEPPATPTVDLDSLIGSLTATWADPEAPAPSAPRPMSMPGAPPQQPGSGFNLTSLIGSLTATWQDPNKPKPTPSGTPVGMPTAPRMVDARITAGPRPGQSLRPGESVGNVELAAGEIDNSSRGAFVRTAYPYALQAAGGNQQLAEQMLATAISEANAGGGKDLAGVGYNFFGQKARPGEASTSQATWEQTPNGPVNITDNFRRFNNAAEGFASWSSFLNENPRYAPAVERYQQTGDVDQLWRDVNAAGYATDSQWADKVRNIRETQVAPALQGIQRTPMQAQQTPQAQQQASGGLDIGSITQAYKDVPYVFGGGGGRSDFRLGAATDCSGFVSSVWKNTYGVDLPAHTDAAYNHLRGQGAPEVSQRDARPGDVVFYMGAGTGGAITHHMGVYAGNGKVMDMAGSGGVKVRDVGHAGKFVIIRDPRINQEPPRQASMPPPIVPTGIAERTGGENLNQREIDALAMNAGAAPAPAAPAPAAPAPAAPAPAAPGDVPPATGGGSQAMWSPDGPVQQPGAFQASAGRSGGAGVMMRAPLGPEDQPLEGSGSVAPPTFSDPTITDSSYTAPATPAPAPAYTMVDGRTAPPTPGGDWQPVQTIPTPVMHGPSLDEDGPEVPDGGGVVAGRGWPEPPNPYGAPRSIAADINPAAPPSEPVPERPDDRYPQGQVIASPGEPDYVDSRPRGIVQAAGQAFRSAQGAGGLLEPAGGIPRIMGRLSEIQMQAAAEMGRNPIDQRVLDDPTWRARNPQLAAEVDDLRQQSDLAMLGNLDAPRRVAGAAAQAAAPIVREAAEGVAARVGGLVDDAARVVDDVPAPPQMLGSGFVPSGGDVPPPTPPRRLTVEVIQQRMDRVRALIAQAEQTGDRVLETDARNVLGDLQTDLIDAMNARARLEPAITSDVGRRMDDLPITEARAERTETRDAQTGFSGQPMRPDEVSGPVSIPTDVPSRLNAGLAPSMSDARNAAQGGVIGAMSEATSDEELTPQERLTRILTGAALGVGAGRAMRGQGAAARLGSGVVPESPRGPGKTFAFGAKPGERLEFNVKVVPLRSLITSHDDALRVNQAFPSDLQPRVRERAASSVQIDRIVNTFDPEQILVDTHRVDSGPMIVGADNVVESGNGRSIALRRLAQEKPEEYARYVESLRAELPRYGLTDDALAGIDQPVLVRERVTDVDRKSFAADANVGVQARMAPIEQAMQDAGRVPDNAVSRIVVGEDQTIDEALLSAENGAFRRAFMATVPESEWGELLDATGNLNTKGLARVKEALLAKTYQGSSGARLATAFIDSLDSGIKNVQHGIMGSLPQVARVEARIAAGEIDKGLSITNDMATAADVYSRLRRRKGILQDYLAQSGMFEGRETTPFQDRILAYIDQNARSPKRIRAMLDEYARTVDGMAGAEQVDMFGMPIPQMTKEEVLDDVLRRLGSEADQSAELGRVGAGSNVVEGAEASGAPVPGTAASVAPDGAARVEAPPSSVRRAPEESLARFQQARGETPPAAASEPRRVAPLRPANLGPANDVPTGGPEGRLEVQGGPQSVGARPGAPEDAPVTGGPEGRLLREGAPPEPANLPPAEGMPATGGPEGTLQAPPSYSPETLRTFQERIRDPEKAEAAAREYQRLVDDGASPETIATFYRNAQDSRWWDRFDILRYASMLSDPVTHGQNSIGAIQMNAIDVVERPLTALLDAGRSRITGGSRDAFLSESGAQVAGMAAAASQGIKDAAFIMAHGLRPEDLAKLDRPTRGFATNMPRIAPRGSKRAAAVDTAMEAPLRALSAADALFRGIATGGHIAAEATRAARKLNGGKPVTVEAAKRLMDNPEVVARATERAAQTVLQEDRQVIMAINSMRSKLPPAAQAGLSVVVPYIKTPYNIVAQGVGMTPAGVISLIGDIKAGKPMADRERRVARMMIGAGVMAWASYENMQGLNTGGYPESEAERSTLPPGWRPYSRKVEVGGETYYVPLALFGQVGIPAMLSVLATEQAKKGNGFSTETAAKIAGGIGQLAEDQTFLRSISDFNDAISKGGNTFVNYMERQASQFSPHLIGGGGVGRRIQAVRGEPGRDPEGIEQAWFATLPYGDQLADLLGREPAQIRRDVIGRPSVPNPSGLAALVPIRASVENDAAVIAAFRRGGEGLPRSAPKTIRDPDTERAITLTPAQKARWQVTFGQALQDGWAAEGRPRHPGDLKKIEQAARDRARDAVLRR